MALIILYHTDGGVAGNFVLKPMFTIPTILLELSCKAASYKLCFVLSSVNKTTYRAGEVMGGGGCFGEIKFCGSLLVLELH